MILEADYKNAASKIVRVRILSPIDLLVHGAADEVIAVETECDETPLVVQADSPEANGLLFRKGFVQFGTAKSSLHNFTIIVP